jgi:hypothetical protein
VPRVQWDAEGARFFETGIDRGMLYLPGIPGVAWNGLSRVSQSPLGGDAREYFVDGQKYLGSAGIEEYSGVIEAFWAPPEFYPCIGLLSIAPGLYADSQPHDKFGFSYRTMIGDDLQGAEAAYKIHLVYNAVAKPGNYTYQSVTENPNVKPYSWAITTIPESSPMQRPTSHFVIDSRKIDPAAMRVVENFLYGTDTTDPGFPTIVQLLDLMTVGVIYAAVRFKKMRISGSGTAISGFTGGVRLEKMKVAGTGTVGVVDVSAASGGAKMKKMKAAGSGAGFSNISAGPKLKKMKAAGSGPGHIGKPFVPAVLYTTSGSLTRTIPVTTATGAGDTLLVLCQTNSSVNLPTAVTDSKGNIYTQDRQATAVPSMTLYRSPGATGGSGGGATAALTTSDSLTVTVNNVNALLCTIAVGLPAALADVYDVIPASISTGTTITPTASATPTQDNDIAIGFFNVAVGGGDPTVNSPYTRLTSVADTGPRYASAAYRLLGTGTSGNSQTCTETSAAPFTWKGILYLFKRKPL